MSNVKTLEEATNKKIELTKNKIIAELNNCLKKKIKVSINALSKKTGVSRSTIYKYIELDEQICVLFKKASVTSVEVEEKTKDDLIEYLNIQLKHCRMEIGKLKKESYKERYFEEVEKNKKLRKDIASQKEMIEKLCLQLNSVSLNK